MQNEKILAYLEGSCLGKANRASGTELERTLHISGTCLRKQVNRLRCKEHPIASDRSGYFYATNAGEVYAHMAFQHCRKAISACRKSFFSPLNKFSEHYKSSENLGFQWRGTPFLGFPRTPFLTVAENLLLYRQTHMAFQHHCRKAISYEQI